MGQLVLGVVGGVAGFVLSGGNPLGASIGFALGSAAGGFAFPQKINAPTVPPTLMQRSNYGATLPIGFGAFRTAGTVIWEGGYTAQTTTQGGKGGPEIKSTAWYATFACAICDCSVTGPIAGIRRIWFNGILVYDVSGSASAATISASNRLSANNMVIYTGSASQGVDPTMQAALGVGNVPAYRNTAYVVFIGIPLANYGNTIPSVSFEAVMAGTGALSQSLEIALATPTWTTGADFYTSTIINTPIILGVGGDVTVIDRNFASATEGGSLGDGSVYTYSTANGALLTTSPQSSATLPLRSWSLFSDNWASVGIDHAGASSFRPYFVMATSDGNAVLNGTGDVLVLNANFPSSPTFVAQIWSVLKALSGWSAAGLQQVYPCSDFAHIFVKATDGGTGHLWAVVAVNGGAASVVAHGSITDSETISAFSSNFSGGSNTPAFNLPGGSSTGTLGCLQSDLRTIWLVGAYGHPGEIMVLQIVGSLVVTAAGQTGTIGSPAGTQAFPVSNACAPTSTPFTLWADNGVCAIIAGQELTIWTFGAIATLQQTNVGAICTVLGEAVGLTSGQLDTSGVASAAVWGMLIERQVPLRDVMNALAPTFWFDMAESDQKLAFRQRSATSVATISVQDMLVSGDKKANESPLAITRADDLSLPHRVDLGYYNIGADYQVGSQYVERLTTQSTQRVSVNAAAIMSDQDAANAASVILWDAWAGRLAFEFSTGLKWGQLEPTDIITIVNGTQSYLARITEKAEAGATIKWKAVGAAPVYNPNVAPGIIVPASQIVSSAGLTTLLLLDLPPLRDQDGNTTMPYFYVCMYGPGGNWPGGALMKSLDGGATWTQINTSTLQSTVGTTTTALDDWTGGNIFDEASTVTVTLSTPTGTLSSATELGVLNGANLCLIGNELLQYKNATLVTGQTYKLSGLLRGRIDTEPAMTGHNSGETFVALSTYTSAAANLNIQAEGAADIGVARDYEAVTIGQALGSGVGQFFTSAANNLVPFYPAYPLAVASPGTTDILLSWVRRNRITWLWLENADVPMSESPSNANGNYVVSIFNGASVVRTITVTNAQSATYTGAQQTTDFGAPVSTLTWGVQQVSAVTGAGKMTKITSTGV